VLVLHAWWGLNETFTGACDRLAAAEFVAFAPDMYGGTIVNTIEDAEAAVGTVDVQATVALVSAATDALRDHPATTGDALGALGFSFGAAYALGLATFRPAAFRAVVVVYGGNGGLEVADYARAQASFQGHFAPGDEWAEPEPTMAMRDIPAAGRSFEVFQYEGMKHWFIEPDRPEYDAEAAELVWQRTIAFLREQLN
jgi:carboxymethylenebutenolidase